MTTRSDELRQRAAELAGLCPPELGGEIAVTGSVSKGFADANSDIEMNFWTEATPPLDAVTGWLESIGVRRVWPDPGEGGGVLWVGFEWRETWFEAGWQTFADAEKIVGEILAAQRTGTGEMMLADVLVHAKPLRTAGWLAARQADLVVYPDAVAEAVIDREVRFWLFPQWVDGVWHSAERGQLLRMDLKLQWDVWRCLALLFALNHRWEPDLKWIPEITRDLSQQPKDLPGRINAIFGTGTPKERIEESFRLSLDTLALLPPSPLVTDAAAVLERSLARGLQR